MIGPERSPERCEYIELGLRLTFTDMIARAGGVQAWVMIRWQGNIPSPRVLHYGLYNLRGTRTVSSITNEVVAADANIDKDALRRVVTTCVLDALLVYTEVHDATPLVEGPDEDVMRRWLLKPFLEEGNVTRLIAAGGSLKSLLALAFALTISTGDVGLLGIRPNATGPTLYLDWEADRRTHQERLRALTRGANIKFPDDIFHMAMKGEPLAAARSRIASAVHDYEPKLIIVDSNAMARGSSGEGAAEDSTIRMFSALKSFDRTVLLIDHKSDEKARRGIAGGYGSVFNRNLARVEWEVARFVQHDNISDLVLRLEKANNIRRGIEYGYRVTIDTNRDDLWQQVTIRDIRPEAVNDPKEHGGAGEDTAADRIASFLARQSEAQTVKAIALACSFKEPFVRMTLNRNTHQFENVAPNDNIPGRWRLYGQSTDDAASWSWLEGRSDDATDERPDPW